MSRQRLLLIPALVLLLYLGVYSWNQRTEVLDAISTHVGLEFVGAVLKAIDFGQDTIGGTWQKYLDLVDVREENERLKRQIMDTRIHLVLVAEERAELSRLRHLLTFSPPEPWQSLGARVLAGRMGSNAALATVIIGQGYLSGALPGTPAMTPEGIVGRVFKAGPFTATVLLLVDPGSRVAVVSQENRVQGILVGAGPFKPLELRFVSHNIRVNPGELLVTSGLDEAYPKGIPVARVTSASLSSLSPFQSVQAEPLANITGMEELLLLVQKPRIGTLSPLNSAPLPPAPLPPASSSLAPVSPGSPAPSSLAPRVNAAPANSASSAPASRPKPRVAP